MTIRVNCKINSNQSIFIVIRNLDIPMQYCFNKVDFVLICVAFFTDVVYANEMRK